MLLLLPVADVVNFVKEWLIFSQVLAHQNGFMIFRHEIYQIAGSYSSYAGYLDGLLGGGGGGLLSPLGYLGLSYWA